MTKLLHLRNTTSGTAPSAANLSQGQLAINVADATLFTLDTTGTVRKIADASILANVTNAYTPTNTTNQLVKTVNGVSPTNTGNITIVTTRNKLMNGRFRFWQRPVPASGAIAGFIADRWYMSSAGATVSQGNSVSAPDFYYLVWQETAGTGTPYISQSVNDVTILAGTTSTFSILANPSKTMTVTPSLIQNFGTGGSTAVTTTGSPITLTANTWTRYTQTVTLPSLAGKTVGPNSYTRMQLATSAAPGTFTLNLTEVQWEPGPSFMGFEFEDIADTVSRCLYYYEVNNGSLCWSGQIGLGQQPNIFVPYQYKRTATSTLTYSSIVVNNMGSGNPNNIAQTNQGVKLQLPAGTLTLGGFGYYNFSMTIDSELPVT